MKHYRTNDKHTFTIIFNNEAVERIFASAGRHAAQLRPYETRVHNCPIMAIGSKKSSEPIYYRWPQEVEQRAHDIAVLANELGIQDADYTSSMYLYDLPDLWVGDPEKIYGWN